MNLLDNKNMQILAVIILAVTVKLFLDHKRSSYKGVYNPSGAYDNITAVKHDMTKALWVELFPLMAIGLASGDKFYDPNDFMGSWLGRTLAIVAGYFTYHEFIQPYLVERLPNW